jgi:cysteine protease ATG4
MSEWRMPLAKPEDPEQLEDFATHIRILSWFFDDPSPLCPFSVHRMALIGKELGKEVGEWFGPSTAAGALKSVTPLVTRV